MYYFCFSVLFCFQSLQLVILFNVCYAISCPSSKVHLKFVRSTTSYAVEESFYLYYQSKHANNIVYEQPSVINYNVATYEICIYPGSYILFLMDEYGDGWSTNSKVDVYVDGNLYGTYRLASSSTGQYTINTFNTQFSYPQTIYVLHENIYFSTSPVYSSSGYVYSVSYGSLPNGLSLNSNTGTISGNPTQSLSSRTVTIRASSSLTYYYYELTFSVIANPIGCSSSKAVVKLERRHGISTIDESFKIHNGNSTTGSVVFTQPSTDSSGFHSYFLCLNPGAYTIHLTNGFFYGWGTGSYVNMYVNDVLYNTYTVKYGNSEIFYAGFLSSAVVVYPKTKLYLIKQQSCTITPEINGLVISFSTGSDTLPTGLHVDHLTGVISGTVTSVISKSVNILVKTPSDNTNIPFHITVYDNPTTCPSSYALVTLNRITSLYASYEDFKIYQNSINPDNLIFSQPSTINSDSSYSWKVCMNSAQYIFVLTSENGIGWVSNSVLKIIVNGETLKTYTFNDGKYYYYYLTLSSLSSFSYPFSSLLITK